MTARRKLPPEKLNSEKLSEQALVVYKALHEQVAFLKKQQWDNHQLHCPYLRGHFWRPPQRVWRVGSGWSILESVLIFTTFVACIWGLVALAYVQCDLGKARKDLDEVDCAIFGKNKTAARAISV